MIQEAGYMDLGQGFGRDWRDGDLEAAHGGLAG